MLCSNFTLLHSIFCINFRTNIHVVHVKLQNFANFVMESESNSLTFLT